MENQQKSDTISEQLILPLALLNGIVIRNGYLLNGKWWWLLLITLPLLLWPVAHYFITIKITNNAKDKKSACPETGRLQIIDSLPQ